MRVNTGFNIDPSIEKLSGVKEIALIFTFLLTVEILKRASIPYSLE